MQIDLCRINESSQAWDRIRPPKKEGSDITGYFLKNRKTKLCMDISENETPRGKSIDLSEWFYPNCPNFL